MEAARGRARAEDLRAVIEKAPGSIGDLAVRTGSDGRTASRVSHQKRSGNALALL